MFSQTLDYFLQEVKVMCQQDSPCAIKTKKKLAGALKELMKTTTFDKITVSDITEKCDVHRQTFYYHFQDRYELLDWIFVNEIIEPFSKDFSFDNMGEKFYNLFETMNANKKFYQSALKTNGDDLTRYISRVASDQLVDVAKNMSGKTVVSGEDANSNEDDDVMIAEFFGYGISGVVMNWALRGMKESPKVITAKIENLFNKLQSINMNIDKLA